MSKNKVKDIDQFKIELDDIIGSIEKNYQQLGRVLFEASSVLTNVQFTQLQNYLVKKGIRKTDQQASIAAFLHTNPKLGDDESLRIDPRLVFAGAKSSKVLCLHADDQARLLSNETFGVLQPSGRTKEKTWADMSDHERNMLIGKGGRILTTNEQQHLLGRKRNMRSSPIGDVEVTHTHVRVTSRDRAVVLHDDIEAFLRKIGPQGWEYLNRAKQGLLQEHGIAS